MSDLWLGLLMLFGSAALWPIRRGVIRVRMGRLTPSEMEWQLVQAEVMLEGFMAFGVIALLGALIGRMPWAVPRLGLFASLALHALASASVAAAVESVRRPGLVTRRVVSYTGVAWLVVIAVTALTSGTQMTSPGTLTKGAPVAFMLGLGAYGYTLWRLVRA